MAFTKTLIANFDKKNKNIEEKTEIQNHPFELMETKHGNLIINKFDELSPFWGVGSQIMRRGYYDMPEINLTKEILIQSRKKYGDGVIALDCGANIGVHSVEWGKLMNGWGSVYSFEAQTPIYYALCGSLVLNSCFNVIAKNIALGKTNGHIGVPDINYFKNSSFGSVEIKQRENTEWIGQEINYNNTYEIPLSTIDAFNFERIDLIKVDVEGMEEDVFNGFLITIEKLKPTIFFEHSKSNKNCLELILKSRGYNIQYEGNNALAIHNESQITINLSNFNL
jgi:FkbM family methyltransferase